MMDILETALVTVAGMLAIATFLTAARFSVGNSVAACAYNCHAALRPRTKSLSD